MNNNLVPSYQRTAQLIHDRFSELPTPNVAPDRTAIEEAMAELRGNSPRTLATIERLLSTGSHEAHNAVIVQLLSEIRMGIFGIITHAPEKLASDLQGLWNSENVAHEAGLTDKVNFLIPSKIAMVPTQKLGDAEWRGLAAFRLAFETMEAKPHGDKRLLIQFIKWAGRESNIARVIELAKERVTMDPETLKALMESEASDTVLRDGIL